MSAIYQRARPIRWDQVVGQEHVKDVLKAALEGGRIGHAYLFSGPRGVGKTTTARLIAMTANCETPGIKPCGECESCLSVRAGSHPDVMEIDAASNNSVDDVRELREKVGLSAMRGGKKIYILDEAHMMSRAAFNALLKTLEEPPEHVIFILATTEPEKIIPTILSRCQHYRFRRLTPEEIAGKLAGIVAREGVNAEPEALQLIGRLADGAMRDGESLLERMLAAGADVTRAGVEAALGLPPSEQMRSMAGALVQGDAGGLLDGAAGLYRAGYAARTVVEGLVTALGQALHAELGIDSAGAGRLEGADVPRLLRLQAALDAQDARFSRGADLQSLELALTHALIAGDGGSGSSGPAAAPSADVSQRLARLEKEWRDLKAGGGAAQVAGPMTQPLTSALDEIPAFEAAQRSPARSPEMAPTPVAPASQGNWADVLATADAQMKALLRPARMHAQQGYVSLSYDDKSSFHARQMVSKLEELSRLVLKVFGPVMLEIIGPTPDSRRKAQVGGRAESGEAAQPRATPVVPAAAAARPVSSAAPVSSSGPPQEPSPFAEARGGRADPSAQTDDVPEFAPTRQAKPASAPAAIPPGASLDDRAPAPLPALPANHDGHSPQAPVAEPLAFPEGTGQPNAEPVPREARSVYLAPKPISEEPDWDDLGLDLPVAIPLPSPRSASGRPLSAEPSPAEPLPAEPSPPAPPAGQALPVIAQTVDQTQPGPEPSGTAPSGTAPSGSAPPRPQMRTQEIQTQEAVAARSRPALRADDVQPSPVVSGLKDLRAHPLYQEATKMWAGRVKEVGKVKVAAKVEAEAEMAEVLAEEELV
ncbi:DNA polymerase III subunit gamma/tau [Deinococcus sp.]|uniref:DNA polymerase III subunit gamma/tau n=1 Tax=Deinococcus sp. TaxID=47478 RepID=UPI003C79ADDE